MRRATGWTVLAGIALELCALAFIRFIVVDDTPEPPAVVETGVIDEDDAPRAAQGPATAGDDSMDPAAFIAADDRDARYYRAADDSVELIAGFYSDGRVRLADAQNHRFAGMLEGGHADLLDLENNQWSEVFVRVTPDGATQLELRGGPYDARVLSCEPLDNLRMTTS